MSQVFEKTVLSDLKALAGLAREVGDFLSGEGVSERAAYGVQFALEELITNIIKYGSDAETPIPVQVRIEVSEREVEVQIRDHGPPFDPDQAPPPNFDTPVLERKPGGLGIFLLKKMSDAFSYTRVRGANEVTVRFGTCKVG